MSNFVLYYQLIIITISLIVYLFLLIVKSREIFTSLKLIPAWLIILNFGILIYKIFFIPHLFSNREDLGVSLLGFAKDNGFINTLLDSEAAALYGIIIKIFSLIFNGVSFVFIVNFNISLAFINCFAVFILANYLFKDKIIAVSASLFYIISPVVFITSLTEDYTNIAIFFSIQAIYFFSFYLHDKKISYLLLSIATSFLAIYSRPEYIVFGFIFVVLLAVFRKIFENTCYYYTILVAYLFLIIPKILQTALLFIQKIPGDPGINSFLVLSDDSVLLVLYKHYYLFVDNLMSNISELFDHKILISVYFVLFFIGLFANDFKKIKKLILFFFFYFLIIFLYYSYFHDGGFVYGYKYTTSLIFPLSILSGTGFSFFYKKNAMLAKILLFILLLYSMIVVSPIMENKFVFKTYFGSNESAGFVYVKKEYNLFKEKRKLIDLNGVFINNGKSSLLDVALPIYENNILQISSSFGLQDYSDIVKNSSENRPIYISQGSRAFAWSKPFSKNGDFQPSCYLSMDPFKFEETIEKYFKIKKIIFSFYTESGYHIFLYEVSFKNNHD